MGRWSSVGVASLVLALAACLFAPRADAFIYWANFGGSSVGRASLDGSDVDRDFINGLSAPCGVAVNATHIFWGNWTPPSIGRARLDGTGVERNLIGLTGRPCGVAVDGAHIWWSSSDTNAVGRANLDGGGVNQAMFSAPQAEDAFGIAVGPGRVYWSQNMDDGSIMSAGHPEPPPIPAPLVADPGDDPGWLAVTGSNIYWTTFPIGIFRANLAGENIDPIAASNGHGGIGALGQRIYWASVLEGTISSANLDGSSPTFALVQNAGTPGGLAVDAKGPPPDLPACGELTLGKLKKNKKKGTGKLAVEVGCAGAAALGGKGVKPTEAQAAGAGEITLPVKAKGGKKKKLRKKGKAKLGAEVTFTPDGPGDPTTAGKKLKLVRKK